MLESVGAKELSGRKVFERAHGTVIAVASVGIQLSAKVGEGVETVSTVESLLILAVTALHFAIVSGRIGADELMPDTKLGSGLFKQGLQVPLAVAEPVGELEAVICLNTFYGEALPFKEGICLL